MTQQSQGTSPGCQDSIPPSCPDARGICASKPTGAKSPRGWWRERTGLAGSLTLLLIWLVALSLHESPPAIPPHRALGGKPPRHRSLREEAPSRAESLLGGLPAKDSAALNTPGPAELSQLWDSAPRVTLLCRMYGITGEELWDAFLDTAFLFWPWDLWRKSDLVLVFDDDGPFDHRMGAVLANMPPFPRVFWEKMPPNRTLCSDWRSLGYSRTMYSNFYSELYTDAEFVAIIDSDTAIVTPVTPDVLFAQEDGKWKPRNSGINSYVGPLIDSVFEILGQPPVAEFMPVSFSFPVMVRRDHFGPMREHLRRCMNASTFEEAFLKICTGRRIRFSHFDIMVHYLWYYQRDHYVWHLRVDNATVILSNATEVLARDVPKVVPLKHNLRTHHDVSWTGIVGLMHDYLCVASNWQAGDCASFRRDDVEMSVKLQLGKDRQGLHAAWDERGLPDLPFADPLADMELPWERPGYPDWNTTVQIHMESIERWNGGEKQWHSWGKESQISCQDYD